jgi:hypothetical protein
VPLLDLAVEVVRKQAARSHCYCAGYAAAGGFAERYQLVRLTNRKFLEHELVDQSKDGRVRSHTERQRKNFDAALLDQLAHEAFLWLPKRISLRWYEGARGRRRP